MLGRHDPAGTRPILTRFASSHWVDGLFWYTVSPMLWKAILSILSFNISELDTNAANLIQYGIKRPFIQWNWCVNTSENYIWNKQMHQKKTIILQYKRNTHWDQKMIALFHFQRFLGGLAGSESFLNLLKVRQGVFNIASDQRSAVFWNCHNMNRA